MNNNPVFVATPKAWQVQATVANTNRDGTGTLVSLVTGGTNGTRIDRITANATVTATAGILRLFLYDGTNTWLWKEITTSAATPSGTVTGSSMTEFVRTDNLPIIDLPTGWIIKVGINNSETWNIQAYGGDL